MEVYRDHDKLPFHWVNVEEFAFLAASFYEALDSLREKGQDVGMLQRMRLYK